MTNHKDYCRAIRLLERLYIIKSLAYAVYDETPPEHLALANGLSLTIYQVEQYIRTLETEYDLQ